MKHRARRDLRMSVPHGLSPDRTPEGWGPIAHSYDQFIAPFLAQYAEDALRLSGLRKGERVLDVAAGTGALSLMAARAGARVHATDFAPPMVALLQQRAKEAGVDIQAEVMDGQDLRVPEGAYDAAYSNFGVIFFPDREAAFRGMFKALRPGGRAAVTAWAPADRLEWFVAFGAAMRRADPEHKPPAQPPAVFSLSDPVKLKTEMEDAGFRNVHVETVRHAWHTPTPEVGVETLTRTNPVVPLLMQHLGPEKTKALRANILEEYKRRAGPDGIDMWGEAHVAVGHR